MACEICGHPFAHRHHLKFRSWGGSDDDSNLAEICPNHHAAIHTLVRWYKGMTHSEKEREMAEWYYENDGALLRFFFARIKPFVVERLMAEGRWHPYVRTLPAKVKRVIH